MGERLSGLSHGKSLITERTSVKRPPLYNYLLISVFVLRTYESNLINLSYRDMQKVHYLNASIMDVMLSQFTGHSIVCLTAKVNPHQRNIKSALLWGEFTGGRWIPSTKTSGAEKKTTTVSIMFWVVQLTNWWILNKANRKKKNTWTICIFIEMCCIKQWIWFDNYLKDNVAERGKNEEQRCFC